MLKRIGERNGWYGGPLVKVPTLANTPIEDVYSSHLYKSVRTLISMRQNFAAIITHRAINLNIQVANHRIKRHLHILVKTLCYRARPSCANCTARSKTSHRLPNWPLGIYLDAATGIQVLTRRLGIVRRARGEW